MRIVTLEEHISFPEMAYQIPKEALGGFGESEIDYPFSTNEMGIEFLNTIELPEEQFAKIAHGNADKLLNLKA